MTTEPKHIISLGAGVQSSTMALMAAHGEISPMPDLAVFADTGAEPGSVYDWLDWLESDNVLPFPILRVQYDGSQAPNLEDHFKSHIAGETGGSNVPVWTVGKDGKYAPTNRGCTRDYKIKIIHDGIQEFLGFPKDKRVPRNSGVLAVQWVGISTDEITRAKISTKQWLENRHPLIELRMDRGDCFAWMKRHDYPTPPRSACYFCPFRTNEHWKILRSQEPAFFERAVELDHALRANGIRAGFKEHTYLHKSLKPLDQVDFDEAQGELDFGFENECEGMCGV